MTDIHHISKPQWHRTAVATLLLMLGSFTIPAMDTEAQTAPNEPLLYQSSVQYIGAFRVPNYHDNTDEMSYGATALAFNPANNSLFIDGHYQCLAEFSIPSSIINSSNLDALVTDTVLQPWTPVLPKLEFPTKSGQ